MKIDRTGEINENKYGTKMIITEYINNRDVLVKFLDEHEYTVRCQYKNFKNGSLVNPYDITVQGMGYLGEGKFNCTDYPKIYNTWSGMLERCYNPYTINKYQTYIDCIVDEWFLCLQNFGEWYEDNYYEVPGNKMCLDKDILIKNNRLYSPETCIFVPHRINALFTKNDINRGELPIGVQKTRNNRFMACCYTCENNHTKNNYLGTYDDIIDAFNAYKKFKEKYIKIVADEYIDYIPKKLYDAMYNYIVDITD